MKVLQINSVCGSGSTGRIAVDLSDVLNKNGHDCLIAYGRGKAPERIKSVKIGSEANVRLHGVYSRLTDRHGFFSKKATERFINAAKEYNPDVVHLHNIHGYYLHLPTLFSYLKESGRPVVWTLHDCWSFTGHCAYFDYAGCEKWKTGCGGCPQIHSYPMSLYADKSSQNYADKMNLFTSLNNLTLVTPSNWLAETVKQSYLAKYPIKVIPNGIDLTVFQPTEGNFRKKHGLQYKKILLGVANIWEPRKGFNDFLRLSNLLDDNYVIVLVGISKEQMNLLPNNIIGIVRTENVQGLAEIYTAADYFINPTYEDNYPTTNLEALACGTPVITYQTGGSPEALSPKCGSVVKQGDVEGLLKEVTEKTFSEKDCLNAAQALEKHLCFSKYVTLYQTILNKD